MLIMISWIIEQNTPVIIKKGVWCNYALCTWRTLFWDQS